MSDYSITKSNLKVPRLPLNGSLDLTYRCNNNCRHCWLWKPENTPEQKNELTINEICNIVDQARRMGTQTWSISGGEPMLRSDFPEIFEYITSKAVTYSINTNGTLITPKIASQLKRKGSKMIALYGATAETYDHITRHPGGFEMAMQGFQYMKEAGAGFIVQLIPMKDNFHEWDKMQELALTLSDQWRVGAAWLHKSADGEKYRNAEIDRQRLEPRIVVDLDKPDTSHNSVQEHKFHIISGDDRIFTGCTDNRNEFHIDAYGKMTFCSFIKDPELLYDLRTGNFQDAWDNFIPSIKNKVHGGVEFNENCGSCDKQSDCRWCGVYSYLEHGRYSAPIKYLCDVADEVQNLKNNWEENNRRYYKTGDITLQIDSDLPILDTTFSATVNKFRVSKPGDDLVKIEHHFSLPDLAEKYLGKEIYRKTPWAIFRDANSWYYLNISSTEGVKSPHKIAHFNQNHSEGQIFHKDSIDYSNGNWNSLLMFTTDQILIAQLLSDREGFYLHSSSAIVNGKGIMFVGHSGTGKTTTTQMLLEARKNLINKTQMQVEILCEDRNIVRRGDAGWRVFGTWSHGYNPDNVSPLSAPLHAICFIQQARENTIKPFLDKKEICSRLLSHVIKPMATSDWWHKTISHIELCIKEVPFYIMRFNKSGEIVEEIERILEQDE
jgi:MoaA/NifB/PqqE/SkfB family radical SAM enzyme